MYPSRHTIHDQMMRRWMLDQLAPGACIPFGLGRLPTGLAIDDPRLAHVRLTPEALRLNTEPLPSAAMTGDTSSHAGRLTLLRDWLVAGSGPYAARAVRFIDAYLSFVAERLAQDHELVRGRISQFDGLFEAEDFTWSYLRPLPRAWVPEGSGFRMWDFAFWDGARLTGFTLSRSGAPGFVMDTMS